MIRNINRDCMSCGSLVPREIETYESDGMWEVCCPKCGHVIVHGFVAKHGNFASGRGSYAPVDLAVGDDTDFNTLEIWITNKAAVAAIHGEVVSGREEVYELVDKISRTHDRFTI